MGINWKVRLKNPVFYVQVVLAVFTPILAYMGITAQDLTSWKALGRVISEAAKNPYVLSMVIVSVWNAVNDPTTAGLSDSHLANTYTLPKKDG